MNSETVAKSQYPNYTQYKNCGLYAGNYKQESINQQISHWAVTFELIWNLNLLNNFYEE